MRDNATRVTDGVREEDERRDAQAYKKKAERLNFA